MSTALISRASPQTNPTQRKEDGHRAHDDERLSAVVLLLIGPNIQVRTGREEPSPNEQGHGQAYQRNPFLVGAHAINKTGVLLISIFVLYTTPVQQCSPLAPREDFTSRGARRLHYFLEPF